MAQDYVRKQIILEKDQTIVISDIAKKDGLSFSELVRNLLNAQLRARTYEKMELAAEALLEDYEKNDALTDMTLLDGEEIIDE